MTKFLACCVSARRGRCSVSQRFPALPGEFAIADKPVSVEREAPCAVRCMAGGTDAFELSGECSTA